VKTSNGSNPPQVSFFIGISFTEIGSSPILLSTAFVAMGTDEGPICARLRRARRAQRKTLDRGAYSA